MCQLCSARMNVALDSQIQNLKDDGIIFEKCSEEEARQYLHNNTYLFRIKRYASNFVQDIDGQYSDLDFAALKDLSVIDYELRLVVEYISGNVEHGLKVRFNNLIMQSVDNDGKSIANLVDPNGRFEFSGTYIKHGHNRGSGLRYSPYSDALVRRYFEDPEIWNLWEVFNLGDLMSAYEAYLASICKKDNATKLFGNFRRMRNAASHSSPLLIDAPRTGHVSSHDFVQSCLTDLFSGKVPAPIPSTVKKSQLVYDYSSLLSIFLIVCNSMPVRRQAAVKAVQIGQRISRNYRQFYAGKPTCPNLRSTLACLIKLSQGFTKYISEENDEPHPNGTLHFMP